MDQASRQGDARLMAAVVDGAPLGMGLWDDNLRCLWVNDGFGELSGSGPPDHLGASPEVVLGELGRELAAVLHEVLLTGHKVIDAEVMGDLPSHPGTSRRWRVSGYSARAPNGAAGPNGPAGDAATCVGAVISDVTNRSSDHPALRVTEEHFRLLVEGVSDYAIIMLDTDGRVITWNTGAQRIMGYQADEILGEHVCRFHSSEAAAEGPSTQLLEMASSAGRAETEDWRVRKDGSRFWAGINITALYRPDGGLRGYSKVLRDLTQQRAAHEALRESETTLRSLLQSASDGVLVVDHRGRIVSANTRAEHLFGYSSAELVGQPIEILVPDRLRDVHRRYRDGFMRSPRTRPMGHGLDLTARRRDGSEFPVEVGLGTAQSRDTALVTVVVTDITQRKQVEAQLAHQATHDSLTGLPNRALFADRLAQALSRVRRRSHDDETVAVLFFDLDRFKVINDSLGHEAGDQVLTMVAGRVRALLRPSDTVARFGGDEFAMLCEGLHGARDAARIARRILEHLGVPLVLPHGEQVVTPSIGIALANRPDADPEDLLRDADSAMYRAKERGGARFELFDAELRGQAIVRLELENGLRRALEHGELGLVYQPIVEISSARPVSVEALLRWQRPGRGSVRPHDFIPVAEETGLITHIGAWVINEACQQAAQWQKRAGHRPLQMSVNLSVRQLAQPDIVDIVEEAVNRARLDPALLRLEITESALMADPEIGLVALRGLNELGISIAIDDFGTGYSSLSRLRQFPVDALKVDREFVDGLGREPGDSAIVAAVVSLSHTYGITTVAEGVETEQQVAILSDLGCEYAQGFYYARPAPSSHIDELLT